MALPTFFFSRIMPGRPLWPLELCRQVYIGEPPAILEGSRTVAQTHTHNYPQSHRVTQTLTHMYTESDAVTHAMTQPNSHRFVHTHTDTDRVIWRGQERQTHAHGHTESHTHRRTHSRAHTHTHTVTHVQSHAWTHTVTHTYRLKPEHTHTEIFAHKGMKNEMTLVQHKRVQ